MNEEILNQLAADMNKLLTEPVGSRSVKITDLTPRDGQQCKLATRVTTDDLLPLCASIDNCGFYAVEVWGGATFDVCMRYLREDPWDRLRRIKSVMPKTKLQMLLRGQHILAYRPYTDKIVRKFVERAIANGMNVFRIFEATNDFRNIETATKAVKGARRRGPCGSQLYGEPGSYSGKMDGVRRAADRGRRGLVIAQRCHGNHDALR